MTMKTLTSAPSVARSVRGEASLGAICACLAGSLFAATCGEALVDACACCLDVVGDWLQRWTDPAAWLERHVTR